LVMKTLILLFSSLLLSGVANAAILSLNSYSLIFAHGPISGDIDGQVTQALCIDYFQFSSAPSGIRTPRFARRMGDNRIFSWIPASVSLFTPAVYTQLLIDAVRLREKSGDRKRHLLNAAGPLLKFRRANCAKLIPVGLIRNCGT